MQPILHFLTEIVGQLANAWFRAHLRLGRIPEGCGHREQPETVVYHMLQQKLFVVQTLAVAERRIEGRSYQASG